MKLSFFKKIIVLVVIIGLMPIAKAADTPTGSTATTGSLASTPGAAIGQALGAGAACFLATKLELFATGGVTAPDRAGQGAAEAALFPWAVPNVVVNLSRVETSNALIQSKDCIRDVVVKMIMDWLVDSTVEWIQNGGEPRFITDWGSFAQDAFNVGVGEIINESNLRWLCQPFALQVRLALLPVPRFQNRITCTLNDIVGNIENFYTDFRNGSWIALEEQWYPENNFYGATLMAIGEAQAEGLRQQSAAQQEAQAGRGFIGVKKCVAYGPDQECTKEEIVTPGAMVGDVTSKALTTDVEWAANVKSWTAALINATLNRLMKEGLSAMKKSIAPKPAGGDYNPYGNYNPNLAAEQNQRDKIVADYQKFSDYFNSILTSKKQSLSSEQQTKVILDQLNQRNCQPPVTAGDIAAAQNEIIRLTADVATSTVAVDTLNINLTYAQNITAFNNVEISTLTQNYSDFTTKYSSLIAEISPGPETTLKFDQIETQTKTTELSSNQSRLNICLGIQSH